MSKITKKQLQRAIQRQESRIDRLVGLLAKKGYYDKESEPQPKQLDQSVFDNMHKRWKFAAIDADGSAHRYNKEVFPHGEGFCYEGDDCSEFKFSLIGYGYDASNWQNSLIERDIAKELTGSDLCRYLKSRKHWVLAVVSDENDATAEFHQTAVVVTQITSCGEFKCGDTVWRYAVPIDHKGEPLTASDVGL